jgi:hypothetical protein
MVSIVILAPLHPEHSSPLCVWLLSPLEEMTIGDDIAERLTLRRLAADTQVQAAMIEQ